MNCNVPEVSPCRFYGVSVPETFPVRVREPNCRPRASLVLGRIVVLRTTESVAGSKQKVVIGKVNGINGGKLTEAVSCHQSLYPYLLYYCHSVPKVRVYEADLLELNSKTKINHGIAICHVDTSSWSPTHGAFLALGSKPGRIEVCHWIFENDMNWAIAD